jgi:hypothetical protein
MATDQQRRFGQLPIKRQPKRKLTREELESGMTLEQLRAQQARLKQAFLERQQRKEAA